MTQEGKRQAEMIVIKFMIIKRFLMKVLKIDDKSATTDACALEHVVSIEIIKAMIDFVDK